MIIPGKEIYLRVLKSKSIRCSKISRFCNHKLAEWQLLTGISTGIFAKFPLISISSGGAKVVFKVF